MIRNAPASLDAIDPAPSVVAAVVEPQAAWTAAPEPLLPPRALFVLLTAVSLLGARRPRRAVAMGLLLALAAFAFESGVHSVHHLGNEAGPVHCAVASASQHDSGPHGESPALEPAPTSAGPVVRAPDPSIQSTRPPSPHEGRAPPARSA